MTSEIMHINAYINMIKVNCICVFAERMPFPKNHWTVNPSIQIWECMERKLLFYFIFFINVIWASETLYMTVDNFYEWANWNDQRVGQQFIVWWTAMIIRDGLAVLRGFYEWRMFYRFNFGIGLGRKSIWRRNKVWKFQGLDCEVSEVNWHRPENLIKIFGPIYAKQLK